MKTRNLAHAGMLLAAALTLLLPMACATSPSGGGNPMDPLLAADSEVGGVERDESVLETAIETMSPKMDQEALAKAAQNPIARMITLPIQYNANFRYGTDKETQHLVNVQPVVPVDLGEGWALINRLILPIMSQPAVQPGGDRKFGMANSQYQGYLTPESEDLIWGFGPIVQIPTSTGREFGPSEWGAGPGLIALTMPGNWVVGATVNNVWGFECDTNMMTLQPFINYNLPDGWYLSTNPILTANWKADSKDRWTIPLGGGIGKIFKIGSQSFNGAIRAYSNVRHPTAGPSWSLQIQLNLLFPK